MEQIVIYLLMVQILLNSKQETEIVAIPLYPGNISKYLIEIEIWKRQD